MPPQDAGEKCNFDIRTSGCIKYLIKGPDEKKQMMEMWSSPPPPHPTPRSERAANVIFENKI